MKKSAEDPKTVVKVELLVNRWCDQISRVLTVNEQIRSEPDDAGPGVGTLRAADAASHMASAR